MLILWVRISVCQHQCLPPDTSVLKRVGWARKKVLVIGGAFVFVEKLGFLMHEAFMLANIWNPESVFSNCPQGVTVFFCLVVFSCGVCGPVCVCVHGEVWIIVGTTSWLRSQKGDSYMNRSRKQRGHREKRESDSSPCLISSPTFVISISHCMASLLVCFNYQSLHVFYYQHGSRGNHCSG